MNEGDIVDHFGFVREQVGNPLATLAVLLEVPARFDDASLVAMPASTERLDFDRFVVHSLHLWLVIERVDVAWSSVHVEEDYRRRLRFEVRLFRSQRVFPGGLTVGGNGLPVKEAVVA